MENVVRQIWKTQNCERLSRVLILLLLLILHLLLSTFNVGNIQAAGNRPRRFFLLFSLTVSIFMNGCSLGHDKQQTTFREKMKEREKVRSESLRVSAGFYFPRIGESAFVSNSLAIKLHRRRPSRSI